MSDSLLSYHCSLPDSWVHRIFQCKNSRSRLPFHSPGFSTPRTESGSLNLWQILCQLSHSRTPKQFFEKQPWIMEELCNLCLHLNTLFKPSPNSLSLSIDFLEHDQLSSYFPLILVFPVSLDFIKLQKVI